MVKGGGKGKKKKKKEARHFKETSDGKLKEQRTKGAEKEKKNKTLLT